MIETNDGASTHYDVTSQLTDEQVQELVIELLYSQLDHPDPVGVVTSISLLQMIGYRRIRRETNPIESVEQ